MIFDFVSVCHLSRTIVRFLASWSVCVSYISMCVCHMTWCVCVSHVSMCVCHISRCVCVVWLNVCVCHMSRCVCVVYLDVCVSFVLMCVCHISQCVCVICLNVCVCVTSLDVRVSYVSVSRWISLGMGWLRLVGAFKLYVSCAKEPYKTDDILQKRHMFQWEDVSLWVDVLG